MTSIITDSLSKFVKKYSLLKLVADVEGGEEGKQKRKPAVWRAVIREFSSFVGSRG